QSNRFINFIVNKAKKEFKCNYIILNREDLNLNNSMFDGKGKSVVGWNNFSKIKSENRFMMKCLAKSIDEQSKNKGIEVLLSDKNYTSQVCINCNYCDSSNRNGINFQCKKCGMKYH